MSQNRRVTLTVVALIVFALVVVGFFISQHWPTKKTADLSKFHGTLLKEPREIKPFMLTGIDNQKFTSTHLQGQWTILFFGFTNCGYLCPTTMAEVGKMYRLLEEKNIKPLPKVIMITLDPKRDNLDKLKQYVKAFNPHFYGAKGDEETLQQMTQEMGIAYAKVVSNPQNATNYDIQHSGALILFNPEGKLSAFFTTPHQAALLAKDYQLLIA